MSIRFEDAKEDRDSKTEPSWSYKEWETDSDGNITSFHCWDGDLFPR